MKSSVIGLAVLGLWAGSSFGRTAAPIEGEELHRKHKWAPRAADELGPPDPDWDEDLAVRDLSPHAFPVEYDPPPSKNASPDLKRRQANSLEFVSFNMQPDVGNGNPEALRKNPARKHQEFFCHWRTAPEGYDVRTAWEVFSDFLNKFPIDTCSGPGGYCTPIYCMAGYTVAVCNWSNKPWEIRCMDLMLQARDIVTALANRADKLLWEKGLDSTRSDQQRLNDQKKQCISHSSVYNPQMLGYTWFNTNPYFQIQLYYGFPDKVIDCVSGGNIFPHIKGKAQRQDDYLWDWYGILTDRKEEELQNKGGRGGNDNKKGQTPVNPLKPGAPPPTRTNRTATETDDSLPLPLETPTGTDGAANYKGPNLHDYDPEDFVPADQVAEWKIEQWRKRIGLDKSWNDTTTNNGDATKTAMLPTFTEQMSISNSTGTLPASLTTANSLREQTGSASSEKNTGTVLQVSGKTVPSPIAEATRKSTDTSNVASGASQSAIESTPSAPIAAASRTPPTPQLSALQPNAPRPGAPEPSTSEPSTSEPSASQPSTPEPSVLEPSASEPSASQATASAPP
ncbi:hypothetical protein DRE_02985 [Drechslerella stenobrocha 248]|uniref:Uncharacterized protein n=1 Tax=Drechslerella stenobrocha 248 TaxID=1043628 RepID=W7IFA8_9PEZI|nr:hypothetical protein DRE_02985 [Drechslerella stenobrocha 248]